MGDQEVGGRAEAVPFRGGADAVLAALPDTVLVVDRTARVVAQVAGPAVPGVGPGLDLGAVLSGFEAGAVRAAVGRAQEQGQVQRLSVTIATPEGPAVYELRVRVVDRERVLAVLHNAGDRRLVERRRGEFLNRVAHDLRTPLTTILLMVDLIRTSDGQEEVAEYWQILRDQVLREQTLVDQLVSVGRLEAGALRLEPQAVDLAPLLEEVVSAAAVTAASRDLRLSSVVEPDLPRLRADPRSLRAALAEVLANALRFTPAGGEVRVVAEPAEAGVRVQVSDSGIGIPAADLPRVGEPFYRASNAPTGNPPAPGLGLAMARAGVEGVGGRLRLDSVEGQGTTVEVWLRAE